MGRREGREWAGPWGAGVKPLGWILTPIPELHGPDLGAQIAPGILLAQIPEAP